MGELFIQRMEIPDVACPVLDTFYTQSDIAFIEAQTDEVFTGEDPDFMWDLYHRGVIDLVDEEKGTYTFGKFTKLLDIFCVEQRDIYRSLPQENQDAIETWYFNFYQEGRDPDPRARVTSDIIVTKDEMIAHITNLVEKEGKRLYLAHCDCKSLKSTCGVDLNTCIGWNEAPNGFIHRGVSKRISLEEAIGYIENADRRGLIHTISKFGLCNCCVRCNNNCCYLFRAMKQRKSTGYWPYTERIISHREEKCIHCGKCISRCQFRVFTKIDGKVYANHTDACVGCGLCRDTCPAGALELVSRKKDEVL